MTRYSELYRKEQAEKERLFLKLNREICRLVETRNQLQRFITENKLEGQFAEWALSLPRPNLSTPEK